MMVSLARRSWYVKTALKLYLFLTVAKDKSNTYLRPILFYTENATNVEVTNIKFLNSPCWNTFFVGSKNIVFDRCRFDAVSNNSNRPKNTDGFDSYNVDGLTIKNTALNVGDDCISPKPNTTNIIVENVWCNGTHGISMGSIGQYPGTLDYITNAHIKNVTLLNGQNGVRLKAWAGPNVGYGYIRNITYDKIHMENTDHPVVIDQCYININASTCAKYPSKVNISDIRFLNIRGTSSGKLGNVMAELRCSPGAECKGIELQNVDVRNRNNREVKGLVVCDGVKGGVGVECVSSEEAKRLNNPNPEKMNE
jgi:galacturan 1,4-alpha-galacturonidase